MGEEALLGDDLLFIVKELLEAQVIMMDDAFDEAEVKERIRALLNSKTSGRSPKAVTCADRTLWRMWRA